jgi:hypothetical protein
MKVYEFNLKEDEKFAFWRSDLGLVVCKDHLSEHQSPLASIIVFTAEIDPLEYENFFSKRVISWMNDQFVGNPFSYKSIFVMSKQEDKFYAGMFLSDEAPYDKPPSKKFQDIYDKVLNMKAFL